MKKIKSLLLVIALVFCPSIIWAAKQDVIDATGRIVVGRRVFDDQGKPVLKEDGKTQKEEWAAGTAFVFEVKDGQVFILTAGHVVDGAEKGFFEINGEKVYIKDLVIRVYTPDTMDDAAVLVLDAKDFKKAPKPLTLLNPWYQPVVGAKVFIYGFPGGKPTQLDAKLVWAQEHAFRTDKETKPGFSGSPVYDEQSDTVFGIVLLTDSKSTNTSSIYRMFKWKFPPKPLEE